MEDGGYYAIKGFDFQIDQTIVQLFEQSCDTDRVAIEMLQDLSTKNFVMQVKYKETQEFSYAKIREPIVQLIELSAQDPTDMKYILYCHFKDRRSEDVTLSAEELENALKIKVNKDSSKEQIAKADRITTLSRTDKENFARRFILRFAENYTNQFTQAINHISAQDYCNSEEEATFLYSFIADYLRKIVITNTDPSQRITNRRTINSLIRDRKRIVFLANFAAHNDRDKYLKYVSKLTPLLRPNRENAIIFGPNISGNPAVSALTFCDFVAKYFDRATYDVRPISVYVPDSLAVEFKKRLISLNIDFNDGYELVDFNPSSFNRMPLYHRKTVGKRAADTIESISFKVRICSISTMRAHIKALTEPSVLLCIGESDPGEWSAASVFKIDQVDSSEIQHFLKMA